MTVKAARERAAKRGLAFNLTVEDLPDVPDTCPVLGIPLSPNFGGIRPQDNSPSLDRIVSSRGYTHDNVHWISWRANALKKDATPDELRRLADYFAPTEPVRRFRRTVAGTRTSSG